MTLRGGGLLRWLLARVTPPSARADLLADLDDETARIAAISGVDAARRWQRRQALRSLAPMLARGLSPRRAWRVWTSGARQDAGMALRFLRTAPVFTVSVVLMLGLGIGAHTVVYAIVDGLLLRPLPFGDRSPRLVTLHSVHPTLARDWDDAEMSYADLLDVRQASTTLEGLEGAIGRNVAVSAGEATERVLATSVTPGLFALLGVAPAEGRDFTASDAALPGFETVAIVSHTLWRSMLDGDPAVAGRRVFINGRAVTVIGVMPPGFSFPEGNQLWLPYRADATTPRSARMMLAIGLLRPDAPLERSRAELEGIAVRLAEQFPETNRDWSLHLVPLRDFFVSGANVGPLLGAVSVLLLVACANVAGLIVARGIARQRELTLRAALGAGRLRLVRLLLAEGLWLAAAGGALGLLLATWGIRAIVAWIPEPPPYWALPALDARVSAFAILVTAGIALLAGLLPALRVSRVDTAGALLPGARPSTGTRSHRRLQHTLVGGQVALTLVLLTSAVLLGRSAGALLDASGGFRLESLLSLRFYMAGDRYDAVPARASIVNDVVSAVAELPGVAGAAATGAIPTDDGGGAVRLRVPGGTSLQFDEVGAQLIPVTPGFWGTLDLRLLAGRTFTASESRDEAADGVIVNRRLARQFWGEATALDRVLHITDAQGTTARRVIGVAPDLVYEEFGESTPQSQLNVYVPYVRAGWRTQALLVRADAGVDPAALAPAVRLRIRGVDPWFAVYDVLTMPARRAYNHWPDQLIGRTFSVFAVAALALACVGAYGITAYSVTQRRREIGIRVAVGASGPQVRNLFLRSGLRLAGLGAVAGAPLAVASARLLQPGLFDVQVWDPLTWLLLPAGLIAAVVAASYLPARRASRIDPAVTLKEG